MRPQPITIYSQNAISQWDTLSVSTGTASLLVDGKVNPPWYSSGSNDSVAESIEVVFYNYGNTARTASFDTLILLGTNIKTISGTCTNAAGNVSTLMTAEGSALSGPYSGDNLLIPLRNPGSMRRVNLSLQTTQQANAEKCIGELKLCTKLLTVNGLTSFDQQGESKQGYYYTADGSLTVWREYSKSGGTLTINNLGMADYDALMAALAGNTFLIFSLYGAYAPDKLHEFAVTEPPASSFDRKAGVWRVDLTLRER